MKNSTEQYASPPMDKRSQRVLPRVIGNIAERNIRCLTAQIETRIDLQKETKLFIAAMYQKLLYQCADFFERSWQLWESGETSQHDKG